MNNDTKTPYQMMFSDYSAAGIHQDLLSLYAYIDGFAESLGTKASIDSRKCPGIMQAMREQFPCKDGLPGASAFKKVANFVAYFVAERPIVTPFNSTLVGPDLARIENHQNAMVALNFAIDALHGAVIDRVDGPCTLNNKIQLSIHSYVDIVDAISGATPSTSFKLLTVLFEQLAYKSNPDCQYDDFVVGGDKPT
jgi:hypothetical protein